MENADYLFGKNIAWKELVQWRVESFTPLAQVVVEKVVAPDRTSPYGLLTVTKNDNRAIIAISHKIDFYHAWALFKTDWGGKGTLIDSRSDTFATFVLVSYAPPTGLFKRMFGAVFPRLAFQAYFADDPDESFGVIYPHVEDWSEVYDGRLSDERLQYSKRVVELQRKKVQELKDDIDRDIDRLRTDYDGD
jgi:hypothetical protein